MKKADDAVSQIYESKVFTSILKTLLVIYILFMIWELYLGQYRSHGYMGYNLIPFKTITGYFVNMQYYSTWILMVNLVGNIAVFVPMGFFISFFLKDRANTIKVVLYSFVILVFVETLQIVFKVGSFDVDDIILNVFGSLLGYLAYKGLKLILTKGM